MAPLIALRIGDVGLVDQIRIIGGVAGHDGSQTAGENAGIHIVKFHVNAGHFFIGAQHVGIADFAVGIKCVRAGHHRKGYGLRSQRKGVRQCRCAAKQQHQRHYDGKGLFHGCSSFFIQGFPCWV